VVGEAVVWVVGCVGGSIPDWVEGCRVRVLPFVFGVSVGLIAAAVWVVKTA
jgi:hypothetical protein